MNRITNFLLVACGLLALGADVMPAAEFHDFGETREIAFPSGFRVLGPDGGVLKSHPEGRQATARGYEIRNGARWYVSDYSWEQMQLGKRPNYMVALEDGIAERENPPAAGFQDFGLNKEIAFPAGYRVLGPDGQILKSLPEARQATARGFEIRDGEKWFVSDYSWEQMRLGKKPNYMVAIGGSKVEAENAAFGEFQAFEDPLMVRFVDGYALVDLAGKVMARKEGYQAVQAVGSYANPHAFWRRGYVPDRPAREQRGGDVPVVMMSLGGSESVLEELPLDKLLAFGRFSDWEHYRAAFDLEWERLKAGGTLDWGLVDVEDKQAYLWYDGIASGILPRDEAVERIRRLKMVSGQLGDLQRFPRLFELFLGNFQAVESEILTNRETGVTVSLENFLRSAAESAEGSLFGGKHFFELGLAYLNRGNLAEAHTVFQARKAILMGKEVESTNTGDNALPNAIGCAIYSASLLRQEVADADVDAWIKAHLRRTVAERLGLSAVGGENNFNIEDYSTFDYRNLLAVINSPEQAARILLSAKGTGQQFQLATGTPKLELEFDDDVTWEIDASEVLNRFGIRPWSDADYRVIDEGTLCFDYARIRHFNPLLPHGNSYFCLAYDRSGVRKMWRVEGDLEATEARIRQLVELASNPGAAAGTANFDTRYAAECEWFLDSFMRPGLVEAASARRLLICPDGPLNFVPFGALLAADGQMLLERYTVSRMPTVRLLMEPPAKGGSASREALVLGNPAFDDASPLAALDVASSGTRLISPEVQHFSHLPGTAIETAQLSQLLAGEGWKPSLLASIEASESNLTDKCDGPDLLHLASHAYYLPEWEKGRQAFGGIRLAGDYSSGVALAGANSTLQAWKDGRRPHADRDGILSAEEMARLDLDGCRLVVMSACETAQGKVLDGEGVRGLTLAAAVAGARNQISTLWPVDDAATVALMGDFYAGFLAGKLPAEALMEAQRKHVIAWRKREGLSAALNLVAPFVCTTTEPFLAAADRPTNPAVALTRVPRLRRGEAGYVTTVNRGAKVWVSDYQPGTVYLWGANFDDGGKTDSEGYATGEGALLRIRDGHVTHRFEGIMHRGKLEGTVSVSDRSGDTQVEENWRSGRPVR